MTDDMKRCYFCGQPACKTPHHIMNKYDKKKSEEWGLMLPICFQHHQMIHDKGDNMLKVRQLGQRRFEELYGHEKWMEVFGKSYL